MTPSGNSGPPAPSRVLRNEMSEVRSTFELEESPEPVPGYPMARFLPDVDGRSAAARRFRDIIEAIVADQGGADRMSEARRQLVRRFAAAAVLAEQLESKLAERSGGRPPGARPACCSSLVRLSARIGINRMPRNVTPSLISTLQHDQRSRAEDAA